MLPSSSAQGANQFLLTNPRVWGKRFQLFFAYFCIFSPVFMCDRTMVPSTTLESFKSGSSVVPDSPWGDLQTHTKTTVSRLFGCLVEMDEKCDFCNTCLYGTQCESVMSQCARCKNKTPTPIFLKLLSDIVGDMCKQ